MLAVLALALGACASQPAEQVVTGVVIGVDGPTAAQVYRVTIRTDAGANVSLSVGTLELTNGGLPAPHLREHLVSGAPITAYARGDVMYRYTDAAE